MELGLADGERYELTGALFSSEHTRRAIYVTATPGSGASVVIRGSVFDDVSWGIHLVGVDEVVVEGNFFRDVGTAIRIYTARRITVRHNQVERFGVLPPVAGLEGYWAGNFLQVVDARLEGFDVGHNLVDRSSDTRPNTQDNTFGEDHININHTVYVGEGYGLIHDNYLRGSATHCESSSGGGIIFDQACARFRVERNVLVNTAQYLLGNANSDQIEFIDNVGFIEWAHDFAARTHYHGTWRGGPEVVVGAITSAHGDGTIGTTLFRGNRLLAERSNADGTGFAYYFNWFPVGDNTYVDNNFVRDDPTGGPAPPPEGVSIIAPDMFAAYGGGAEYFPRRCLP